RLRCGIPSSLRGRVWKAAVFREVPIEEQKTLRTRYPRMATERSGYAKIISRDLARTFPGVPLFAKVGGEGQKALGKVMRAYSVYDPEVGYCQGLGFLVGPLLMNMSEEDTFCAFVQLMKQGQIRSMFIPSMEGLHLRLFQFSAIMEEHMPELHAHLEHHAVPTALYASQWYLTMFAYSYPMRFVLRIWDVAMAEG
ncbi:rab-GTPase-TBC domain-containing protein, partial [Piptocephalis cylindrospora]